MSYRSVKHVLGETRLELKFLLLFAICLLTLIGGSFWWYGSRSENLVYDKAKSTGRDLVDAAMLEYHMQFLDAPGNKALYQKLAPILKTQNFTYSFLKPSGYEPQFRPHDENEAKVVERFLSSIQPTGADSAFDEPAFADRHVAASENDGKAEYQYFQPIYVRDKYCLDCHQYVAASIGGAGSPSMPQLQEGDLIAVAKIVIPDDATQEALNVNRAIFLAVAIITVFLAMVAAYTIVRYIIVKPLKHLRDVSDQISQGNMEARADINTADEFEEVGLAFNKMVRHLVNTQDELKTTNATLDGKVDELAQTNMRLYEMNRLKSDFLATMSHELRTPLNSIIGFSEVLDSIKSLDDKQRRYVQNIQKSGRVLLDMINDILDLAKIESGKMDLKLSDFQIDRVVQAQCDFVRPQTERKNIDLDVEVDPDLPEVFQDQAKIQQILSNLLSNAIKFTPEGGRITVAARRGLGLAGSAVKTTTAASSPETTEQPSVSTPNDTNPQNEPDHLQLVVSDTGVGIAEEDQTAIFEKFRQGQAVMAQGEAITREYSGTGLGLSIVKELCKLLGGEILLESQIGRGSTFTVQLPWTCPGHARVDPAIQDNLEEMLRPWRQEVQRTMDRPVPAAPAQR